MNGRQKALFDLFGKQHRCGSLRHLDNWAPLTSISCSNCPSSNLILLSLHDLTPTDTSRGNGRAGTPACPASAKDTADTATVPSPSQHKEVKEEMLLYSQPYVHPIYYEQWTDANPPQTNKPRSLFLDAPLNGRRVSDADDWLCVFARAIRSPETIAAACANRCDMFSTSVITTPRRSPHYRRSKKCVS